MSTADSIRRRRSRRKGNLPIPLVLLLFAFALAGTIALLVGHRLDPTRFWTAYLVNFLFFTGIGAGGVLFACVIHMASGRWGRNVKRIAEGLGLFLPVSAVLFLLMIPGLRHVLPWVEHPYGPAGWMNLPFMIARNATGLTILAALGTYLIYRSIRQDVGAANESGAAFTGNLARFASRNWRGLQAETDSAGRALAFLAPVYTIGYAVVLTLVAMDLIMSLKPGWYSTLIGGYYFAGCFYTALAALLVATVWTRRRFNLHDQVRANHLHDIAKLAMAFGVVTGDFFYSQLLLIWYGNLPVETSFLLDRWHPMPWRFVGIAVLLLCFALPLVAMLKRSLKEKSAPMVVFGAVVLLAMWAERFFLVVPSILGPDTIRFGLPEVLVTMGFVGLMGLFFVIFMHSVPPVVVRDPILDDKEVEP